MFLVLGILIVLFLITIKIVVEPGINISRPGEFDTINIRNEFSNVQKYSNVNQNDILNNIHNFTSFVQTRLNERKIDFDAIFVNAYIGKENTTNITISIDNFLGSAITIVNASFGNATGTQGSFNTTINNTLKHSQNISVGILAQEKHINVTYTHNNVNKTIFFTFTPKNETTTVITFYDLTYRILDKVTRDQFTQIDYL